MTKDSIVFDPSTGLPQLSEDFAFIVSRASIGYSNFEVTGDKYSPTYSVAIQRLEPQRRKEDVPVYEKGWLGMKNLVRMKPGELIPREPEGYNIAIMILADELDDSFNEFPSKEVKEDYDSLVTQYKNSGTKVQKFRRQELNDENIKKAAIQCFLYWKEKCRRDEERELEAATQRALENKYCGTYPPKGINIG